VPRRSRHARRPRRRNARRWPSPFRPGHRPAPQRSAASPRPRCLGSALRRPAFLCRKCEFSGGGVPCRITKIPCPKSHTRFAPCGPPHLPVRPIDIGIKQRRGDHADATPPSLATPLK
jgi:hypothetical protein